MMGLPFSVASWRVFFRWNPLFRLMAHSWLNEVLFDLERADIPGEKELSMEKWRKRRDFWAPLGGKKT